MTARFKKRRKRAAVRIPPSVLQATDSCLDEVVETPERSDLIGFEPVRRGKYAPTKLVRRITRGNSHEEVDFGKPVGKEAW